MTTLGEKLRRLRQDKGMTLEELSTQFNERYNLSTNRGMISRWENDRAEPSNQYLSAYAKLFNVNMNYLYDVPEGYYTDPLASEYAEICRTNPNIRVLFSASRDITKEQMEKAVEYIKFLKSQEKSDNDFSE